MIFRKKEKPLTLEIYTNYGDLIDLFPPIIANKNNFPSWYKNVPTPNEKVRNVRHCEGFKDLMQDGFFLQSWGEFKIRINDKGAYVQSPVEQPQGHSTIHVPKVQAPGAWDNYWDVKLHSPWWIYCNEPIKWVWMQPVWYQTDPSAYISPTGITEFRYQHQTNINLLFKIQNEEYEEFIKPGQMLAHIIPLTERPIEYKIDVLSESIWKRKFAKWSFAKDFIYQKTRAMKRKEEE